MLIIPISAPYFKLGFSAYGRHCLILYGIVRCFLVQLKVQMQGTMSPKSKGFSLIASQLLYKREQ
jgi:hypothetical protein